MIVTITVTPRGSSAPVMMMMMMALFCLSKRTPLLTHFFLTHSSNQRRDQALEHFDCQVGSGVRGRLHDVVVSPFV